MAISNRPLNVGDINTWSLDGQVNIFYRPNEIGQFLMSWQDDQWLEAKETDGISKKVG